MFTLVEIHARDDHIKAEEATQPEGRYNVEQLATVGSALHRQKRN